MATRLGRKWCDPCVDIGGSCTSAPYLSIFVNNIHLRGAAVENTPPFFIVNAIATRGGVCYVRDVNEWYAYQNVGKNDRFGYPRRIKLYLDGGALSEIMAVDPDIVCIFPANAQFYAPVLEIEKRVATLNEIGLTLAQNLRNIRQCAAIVYDDEQLTKNIEQAICDRLEGKSMVKIKRALGQNIEVINFGADAVSFIPDLLAAWSQTTEELNSIVGTATVGEKQERRISQEIALIEDSSSAIIDLLINTINEHARMYNVDIVASRRAHTEYVPAQEATETATEGDEEVTE